MTYVRNEQAEIAKQVRPNKDCSGFENLTKAVWYSDSYHHNSISKSLRIMIWELIRSVYWNATADKTPAEPLSLFVQIGHSIEFCLKVFHI